MKLFKSAPYLLALLFIISPTNGRGQHRITWSIYTGASITGLSGLEDLAQEVSKEVSDQIDEEFEVTAKSRACLFVGGANVAIKISETLAIQGGIEYAPRGGKLFGDACIYADLNMVGQWIEQDTWIKLGYIDFPLSIQLYSKSKPGNTISFKANLGFSPAFKVYSKMDVSTRWVERTFEMDGMHDEIKDVEFQSDRLEGIKAVDMGCFGTLGICSDNWTFDLKFQQGLVKIGQGDSGGGYRNWQLSLTLGYQFGDV